MQSTQHCSPVPIFWQFLWYSQENNLLEMQSTQLRYLVPLRLKYSHWPTRGAAEIPNPSNGWVHPLVAP